MACEKASMKESVVVYPKQRTAIICPALSLNWEVVHHLDFAWMHLQLCLPLV